jgi:hypothetical protein
MGWRAARWNRGPCPPLWVAPPDSAPKNMKKHNPKHIVMSSDDRALIVALLERESELGPVNRSQQERQYQRDVTRIRVAIAGPMAPPWRP